MIEAKTEASTNETLQVKVKAEANTDAKARAGARK